MITYNPKDWFKLIFQFHKSDTVRILLPTLLLLGGVTAAVCFLENYLCWAKIPSLTIFHQISGFIISMVLVFRINTAYDRWWEGRRQWGALVNNCRNLAMKLNAIIPLTDAAARSDAHEAISSFPFSLKEHLRNNPAVEDIQFNQVVPEDQYRRATHKPNYIAKQLTAYCHDACKKYGYTASDYRILCLHLSELTDVTGACERIKNTPIPYSYSIYIKKIIFIYIITMPVAFGMSIGYWSVPVVMIIFYAFASLELISEEIEDPFGTDSNDLPTDELSVRIKNNVREILIADGN